MKHLRLIFLCTVLMLGCYFTGAGQISLAAKAGITFADQSYRNFSSQFNPGILPGIMLGGFGEYAINDQIRVSAGLQIGSKGYRSHDDGEANKLSFTYITLPVQVQYHKDQFMGAIGFYSGMAMGVKYVEEDGDDAKPELGNKLGDDFSPNDFGIQLEGGYDVTSKLRASISYSLGLANIVPGEARKHYDSSIRNSVIGLNLAYFLNID